MNTKSTFKRWSVVNRKTGKVRTSKTTRELARIAKRPSEYIFDSKNNIAVR